MSEEIDDDDLDTTITKAVLEAIANRSEIGETSEIADKLKKAAEILKDCMENNKGDCDEF
jgi:hypothetical protein